MSSVYLAPFATVIDESHIGAIVPLFVYSEKVELEGGGDTINARIKQEVSVVVRIYMSEYLANKMSALGIDVLSEDDDVEEDDDDDDGPVDVWDRGEGTADFIIWLIKFPLVMCMHFTIPDCKSDRFKDGNWFWLTFFMSIVWIAALAFVMVWMATVIGIVVGIPDPVYPVLKEGFDTIAINAIYPGNFKYFAWMNNKWELSIKDENSYKKK